MNFFIKTFGCQMNVNDSEKMRFILEKNGLLSTDDEMGADIIIVNSCAVRERAQEKIFSYIGRIPENRKIIVAGCVAQSERENIRKRNPRIDYILGTHQFYRIDEIVDEITKNQSKGLKIGFSKQWTESVPDIVSRESTVSAYISIMEGCNNFCSYCIVPFARGREKHRPMEKIIKEAEFLWKSGYKEIILLGQNVNNWEDRGKKMGFPDLLDYLAERIGIRWIRFITSYPGYHDDELIGVMKKHRNLARHIHFPAQSGSTRILKRMNRIYSRDHYLKIIKNFKKDIPEIKFSSDFIVGFPSESDNDFKLTLSLIKEVEYESIFSFMYSPRKHTRAVEMKDDIDLNTKKQRLYELQHIQKEIQLRNNKKRKGELVEVLVTERNPRKMGEVIGRAESYRVVNFKSNTAPGEFTNVLVENVGPHSLRGRDVGQR